MSENLIPIPGRLHSVVSAGHVAGADEIIDDDFTIDGTTGQSQADINSYLDGKDPLPSQSGNSGKFLTTDGTDASWAEVNMSAKADKLPMTGAGAATENNLMAIDASGNIKDSGKKANDFQATLVVGTNLDSTPTANSNNPVTSGGTYTAMSGLNEKIKFLHEQLLIPDAERVIMTSDSNPVAMQVCYQQGWALNPDFMTYAEAQAVTDIGTAFRGNTELSHFEELQYFSITELDAYAFSGCSALASLGLPPSLTKLDKATTFVGTATNRNGLFIRDVKSFCEVNSDNNSLCLFHAPLYVDGIKVTFLGIPDGTVSIGNQIFGYAGLTGVSVPASVAAIGSGVFTGNAVKKYVIGKSLSQWCGQQIGSVFWSSAAEEITFNGVALGSTLTIPNDVTAIGSYVFSGIGFVKTVIIPNSVTTIGISSFSGCGAETVEIGSGITSMTWGTFDGLGNLKTLRCRATTAPSITVNTFKNSGSSQTTLYVPANSTGYDTGNWASAISANGWTLSKTL